MGRWEKGGCGDPPFFGGGYGDGEEKEKEKSSVEVLNGEGE